MRFAALGLFCVSVLGAASCDSGNAKPAKGNDKPRDARTADADVSKLEGAQLYTTFCSHCHGTDLKGYKADNAPSLNNKTFLESADDDFLRRSINAGRPGTSMAAYATKVGGPLDEAAVDRLVKYIRAQGPAPIALPASEPGDAAKGQALYTTHCVKCHGDATSRGTALHLANPQFLATANNAFLTYAITNGRPGTPMESFAAKLQPKDINDVVAFVRTYAKQIPTNDQLPAPTGKEPMVLNPKGKDPVWKKLKPDEAGVPNRYVSVDEVNQALKDKRKIAILDARAASDWMRVHIAGAVSVPHFETSRLSELPDDVWAIAYCGCPHHLSGILVEEIIKRGHKKALVLDEGIFEWQRRGYPVTAAPGVVAPPPLPGETPPTPPGTPPTPGNGPMLK